MSPIEHVPWVVRTTLTRDSVGPTLTISQFWPQASQVIATKWFGNYSAMSSATSRSQVLVTSLYSKTRPDIKSFKHLGESFLMSTL